MSAFRCKADMTVCGCLLLRSLLGVKRTCSFALHMSAYDPKRTSSKLSCRSYNTVACERTKARRMDKTALFTDGEAYERMMGRWSRVASEAFLAWLDLPKGLRWLDVGCGNGAFTEEIIARCNPMTVVAIDPSEEQLAFARTRSGTKMAKFEVGDAHKLSFSDGTFDVAIMALLLAFLPDPAKAVEEMMRTVCPSGWGHLYVGSSERRSADVAALHGDRIIGFDYSVPA